MRRPKINEKDTTKQFKPRMYQTTALQIMEKNRYLK